MATKKVIIIGGGFAGCAAAITARKAGVAVTLVERTDMLLAGGNRGGEMNQNGKLVAAEEAKELGAGEIFESLESIIIHRAGLKGEEHAYVYNAAVAEPVIRRLLKDWDIELLLEKRATDVTRTDDRIISVTVNKTKELKGDAFVDCSGTSGGITMCKKYGMGCVMCASYRCVVFGDRVSIATRAGVKEFSQRRPDGTPGLVSAPLTLHKSSLEKSLRTRLENDGVALIPLPRHLVDYSKFEKISSIGLREHQDYLNLVDIGPVAKCVKLAYMPLSDLRSIPGLENAQIEDPLGGGRFGFIKEVSIAPRDNTMKAPSFTNLFVGGEKSGPIGGIAESIVTGLVAGNNAARAAVGAEPLELPATIAIGDYIAYAGQNLETEQGLKQGFRMGQGSYFQRMKEKGLYSPDPAESHARVRRAGLSGIMARKVN